MASLGLGHYGSWLNVVSTITTNQQNLNLWTYINNIATTNYGWNRATGKKLRGIITINSGVNIYSTNPLIPAITVPADGATTFRSYDQVLIINNGTISGASGFLGTGGENGLVGNDGGKGGTAIYTRRNIIISNNGNIYGGGGGGGGGGGAFNSGISDSSTNCGGASYCGKCCLINCQGSNFCGCSSGGCASTCTPGAACGSSCNYASNTSSCNGSTVGTCNTRYRWCTSYKGSNGGKGQGYLSPLELGVAGVIYGAGIFTGSGGNGGSWGQDGEDGTTGSQSSYGNGGQGGCWIDGYELLNFQNSNDERGYQCTSSGSQTLPVLWSGWSSTPSITTEPADGSGVTLLIDGNNLQLEPRQSLTFIKLNSPTNLGGSLNLSNCTLLETLSGNTQYISALDLTKCINLKNINFTGNNLSTLNVSSCTSLQKIYLDYNQLQGNLNGLSNISTSLNETRIVSIKNNAMSTQNLNDIFNQLPSKPPTSTFEWQIHINDNLGTCACDWTIAKNKGWRVYPELYNLTSNVNTTNEGTSVNFVLNSTLLEEGSIPYTITGINSADINGASLTGNFSLYKGSGIVTFDITNDVLLEETETMTLTINSATCPTSKSVIINDTSRPFIANIIISSNTNNYNSVSTFLNTNGWDGIEKVNLTLTVNSGVTVGSTSSLTPALTIPVLPAGSVVTIINRGNIYGAGGSGGSGTTSDGTNGLDGGTSISTSTPITINNYGNIKGGGGGGGGGAGYIGSINCNCISSKQKSGSCCECSSGCTSPKPGYQYHECLNDQNCYYTGCAWGGDWRQTCYSYNLVTTCSTCDDPKSGGNGGRGQGYNNDTISGTNGTSGTSGGNGGAFGTNGSTGGSYNANNIGGNFGLAGYYLKTSSGATYVITSNLGGTVAGRIA